jgi:hypothetical protein
MARRQALIGSGWLVPETGLTVGSVAIEASRLTPSPTAREHVILAIGEQRRRRDLMLCYRHTCFALYNQGSQSSPARKLVKLRSGKAMTLRLWTTRRRLLCIAFRDGSLRVHAITRLYTALEMKLVLRSQLLHCSSLHDESDNIEFQYSFVSTPFLCRRQV